MDKAAKRKELRESTGMNRKLESKNPMGLPVGVVRNGER